ncbi:MAG: hypothetical protein EB127_05025 [Alphaproteobacteria bacterium]|nr:hypothetical protein [Alphaproteobacteria bacterium]
MTHHNEKKSQLNAVLASYGRSVLGAALALYMSGVTDPKTLAYSLLAAIAPVALRALNPNDTAFGRMPALSVVEDALAKVKVKAPVKKAAPKKKSSGGGKPANMA